MTKLPSSRDNLTLIVPTDEPPFEYVELHCTPEVRHAMELTYFQLCGLVHDKGLSQGDKEDILLLLSTCRNEWFTANAIYAEALKWCAEGKETKYSGYGDALDAFRSGVSGQKEFNDSMKRAATRLEISSDFLAQFREKHIFYFERFGEVYNKLLTYANNRSDPAYVHHFHKMILKPSASDVRTTIRPPGKAKNVPQLHWLRVWYSVVQPLNSLTRTYISNVLRIGKMHHKSCSIYLERLLHHAKAWHSEGFDIPEAPPEEVFTPRSFQDHDDIEVKKQLRGFLTFCDNMLRSARQFLDERIVEDHNPATGFLLKHPEDKIKVTIEGQSFELHPNMFVLITDMRNSVGAKYESLELKVKMETIINRLRESHSVSSQTVYDDCRIIACESAESLVSSVQRLHGAFNNCRRPNGFDGLRMGLSFGEMLYDFNLPEPLITYSKGRRAPLDSANLTIARANRVMGFDKSRWEESQKAEALNAELQKNFGDDMSLLFLDYQAYRSLPESIRKKCISLDLLPMKGLGQENCYVIQIDQFHTSE